MKENPDFKPEEYPIAVTLRFRSVEEKDWYLAQLSDGAGENLAAMDWDWTLGDPLKPGSSFEASETFLIDPFMETMED